jgi:hypothetical protein
VEPIQAMIFVRQVAIQGDTAIKKDAHSLSSFRIPSVSRYTKSSAANRSPTSTR